MILRITDGHVLSIVTVMEACAGSTTSAYGWKNLTAHRNRLIIMSLAKQIEEILDALVVSMSTLDCLAHYFVHLPSCIVRINV